MPDYFTVAERARSKSGYEERLRDLRDRFRFKRKHPEEQFARSFPEAFVLNTKLSAGRAL